MAHLLYELVELMEQFLSLQRRSLHIERSLFPWNWPYYTRSKEKDENKIYAKIVRGKIKNACDSDITITISGKFIVENNLVPIWRKLRGFSEDLKIDDSFEDIVSIHQASVLGLFPNS